MNKIILIGRLTKDPELKTTNNGTNVCSFTIAVNRKFKNASGNYDADFINCVAWKQSAEFVSKYFTKGRMIAVEGSLQTRSYKAQDGSNRSATEVMVESLDFCGDKPTEVKPEAKQEAKPNDGFVEVDDGELPF